MSLYFQGLNLPQVNLQFCYIFRFRFRGHHSRQVLHFVRFLSTLKLAAPFLFSFFKFSEGSPLVRTLSTLVTIFLFKLFAMRSYFRESGKVSNVDGIFRRASLRNSWCELLNLG